MSKGLSWFILLAALFGFLALCVLLFIPMLLEGSIFRPELERWISRGMGRSVSIQGLVKVSLVPQIRISLSGLRIPASQGFPEKDLMRIDSLQLQAPLSHILRNGLKPRFIWLQGFHLVMERDREKGFGWPETPRKGKNRDGSDDPQMERPARLRLPAPLLGLLSEVAIQISEAELICVDLSNQRQARITDMSLSIEGNPSDGPQWIRAQGNMQGHPFTLQGSLQASPRAGAAGKLLLIELAAQVGGRLEGSLKGQIRSLGPSTEADLQVRVEPFSWQPLLMAVGYDPKGSFMERWQQVSFQGNLILSPGSFQVEQAELRADDSLIKFSMASGKGSRPGLMLNLETEELDLNSLFQASVGSKQRKRNPRAGGLKPNEHTKAPAGPKLQSVALFPLSGSAMIHRVLLKSQTFEDLQVSYRFEEGVLELQEVRVKLEGGELLGRGSVNFHGPKPYVHLDLKTMEVQVGPVLQRLAGTLFLEGRMGSHWDLEGPWEGDLDQAALTWKGQADILLKDGSINGVDLSKVSRSLGLAGDKKEKQKARTPFSSLEAHLGLEDGSLKVSKASMQNKDLRILAAGRADLLEKSLDFRLEPELGSREEGQEGAVLVVPLWVDGSFSHPKIHPDLAGIRKKGEGKLHLSIPSTKELKEVFRNFLKGR